MAALLSLSLSRKDVLAVFVLALSLALVGSTLASPYLRDFAGLGLEHGTESRQIEVPLPSASPPAALGGKGGASASASPMEDRKERLRRRWERNFTEGEKATMCFENLLKSKETFLDNTDAIHNLHMIIYLLCLALILNTVAYNYIMIRCVFGAGANSRSYSNRRGQVQDVNKRRCAVQNQRKTDRYRSGLPSGAAPSSSSPRSRDTTTKVTTELRRNHAALAAATRKAAQADAQQRAEEDRQELVQVRPEGPDKAEEVANRDQSR